MDLLTLLIGAVGRKDQSVNATEGKHSLNPPPNGKNANRITT